jgi:heme/copper-type cytochrome/quinol oxidase subunit 2
MSNMQRILIAIGAVLLLVGLLWPWLSSHGLGRLPGDIRVETENGVFYFPITTCVVISIVLSLVIWFIRR